MKQSRVTIILLLFFSCAFACRTAGPSSQVQSEQQSPNGSPVSPSSYGNLAAKEMSQSLENSLAAAAKITSKSLPHEGKSLRSIIGRFRDMMDIFVYALPVDNSTDFFLELRSSLDQGYEQVGFFKDLYEVQGLKDPTLARYDAAEVEKLLKPVLAWQEQFMNPKFVETMKAYVAAISEKTVGPHKKASLSKFYWKDIPAEPKFTASAEESLRTLVDGLLQQARREEEITLAIKNLLKSKEIETFHDFRKRVRAVVEICQYFPERLALGSDSQAVLGQLDELVDRYGDLHTDIIRFERAEKQGDDKKAKKLEKQIAAEWSELQVWQKATIKLNL